MQCDVWTRSLSCWSRNKTKKRANLYRATVAIVVVANGFTWRQLCACADVDLFFWSHDADAQHHPSVYNKKNGRIYIRSQLAAKSCKTIVNLRLELIVTVFQHHQTVFLFIDDIFSSFKWQLFISYPAGWKNFIVPDELVRKKTRQLLSTPHNIGTLYVY